MPPPRDSERWRARRADAAVWRRLRSPFALPRRLAGHDCGAHWEAIDADAAGCRLCGRVHFCSSLRDDVAGPGRVPGEDCECAAERLADSVVCAITGFCVRERVFADEEFVDTATIESSPAPRAVVVEYHDVLRHVRALLCSEAARACLRRENERAELKLAHTFRRVLREHKARHPRLVPNIVHATAALVARSGGGRARGLVATDFDAAARDALAATAAAAATRLVNTFAAVCPALVAAARRQHVVVGLLYLMRTGVVVRGTRVLHLIPELRDALPPESALQAHFGVRCGAVTETENLVKMAARGLSRAQLAALGADTLAGPLPAA
jgi:hypothetical protein